MTDGDRILRGQAWDYFAIVAAQRLLVISFYIGIGTLLAGGQFALLQTERYSNAAAGLGVLLAALSFVFWKWDRRSSDLIKLAEGILIYYEGRIAAEDGNSDSHGALLFMREHEFTTNKKIGTARSVHSYFTYRVCLNFLYGMFSIIGLGVALMSVIS